MEYSCHRKQVRVRTLSLLLIVLLGVQYCGGCRPNSEIRLRRSDKDAIKAAIKSKLLARSTNGNSTLLSPGLALSRNVSSNSTDGRPKRQLFREDIPIHRPLTGNHYALVHGFPHAGRWTGRSPGGGAEGPPTHEIHGFIPHSEEMPGFPPHAPEGDAGPHYQTHGVSNEVVHEYPVQVSPVISLAGHQHLAPSGPSGPEGPIAAHPDVHAPPKVHPDQDPAKPLLAGQGSNLHHPPDLVVHELNGEPGPTGLALRPVQHGNPIPNGGYESFGHGPSHSYHYGKPVVVYGPPYVTGAQKIAHFLKT